MLRLLFGKLRDLSVGLGLISVVSFLPQPLVQGLPDHVQQAVAIAGDIRNLTVVVSIDGSDVLNG